MPNRRSEQLLGASSELTAGSGLLGPHRRVVTLIDRNGESMLTPDLVAVLSESAHNQPLSDLSILTKLLLEQLRTLPYPLPSSHYPLPMIYHPVPITHYLP